MKEEDAGPGPRGLEQTINYVTIPLREYEQLQRDSYWLSCLEDAGVDNWPGIDYAKAMFNEFDEDDD